MRLIIRPKCTNLTQICLWLLTDGTREEQNVPESLTVADSGFVHRYILNFN